MTTETRKLTPQEIEAQLAHCYGSENWYRHGLVRGVLYTDGVKLMAELCGAYWLVDAIASYQIDPKIHRACEGMQFWTLKKNGPNAVLTCRRDSGEPALVRQEFALTDFPFDEFKLYVEGEPGQQIILLPSEH